MLKVIDKNDILSNVEEILNYFKEYLGESNMNFKHVLDNDSMKMQQQTIQANGSRDQLPKQLVWQTSSWELQTTSDKQTCKVPGDTKRLIF